MANWKRVQGANGKLQGKEDLMASMVSVYRHSLLAFGFCEYENPEGTLRCIRLLNGYQIQDKKLVVSDSYLRIVFFSVWLIDY